MLKKKYIGLLLSGMMFISALTACGNTNTADENTITNTVQNTTETSSIKEETNTGNQDIVPETKANFTLEIISIMVQKT